MGTELWAREPPAPRGPQPRTAGLARLGGGPQEDLRSHPEPFWLSSSPNLRVIKAQPPKLPDPGWGSRTQLWRGALPLPEPGLLLLLSK